MKDEQTDEGVTRRDLLKGGAAGFLLGFLFRGRNGALKEEPEVIDQPPSAVTITTAPQRAFRPERLMIAGTAIGTKMVPETEFVLCTVCNGICSEDEYQDDYCEACNGYRGKLVETGRMVERDVTIVPWTIESITIGPHSQLASEGLPGALFSTNVIDTPVSFDTASEGQEIQIIVRYTGDKPEGEVFRGALIGTALSEDGVPTRSVLPIRSSQKIVA